MSGDDESIHTENKRRRIDNQDIDKTKVRIDKKVLLKVQEREEEEEDLVVSDQDEY